MPLAHLHVTTCVGESGDGSDIAHLCHRMHGTASLIGCVVSRHQSNNSGGRLLQADDFHFMGVSDVNFERYAVVLF